MRQASVDKIQNQNALLSSAQTLEAELLSPDAGSKMAHHTTTTMPATNFK